MTPILRVCLVVSTAFIMSACGSQVKNISSLSGSTTNESYVRIPAEIINKAFIEKFSFNRDHIHHPAFAFGYIPTSHLDELKATTKVDELNAFDWARNSFDLVTLEMKDEDNLTSEVFEKYHYYNDLTVALEDLVSEYPALISLHSAGKSERGLELWYVRISKNVTVEANKPKLLYLANMHGDETVGRELMIYLIEDLVKNYDSSPRFAGLLDYSEIFIMPSMNPDGFEKGRRSNNRGSDLNRNFPDFTSDPNDRPNGREVETQHVMQLHKDHHFVSAVNFHGGAIVFNLPWDTQSNRVVEQRFGDDPLMKVLARKYADTSIDMTNSRWDNGVTYGYEWYEVNGGLQDWASYYRQSMHATIELSNTKFPAANKLPYYWDMNREGLIQHLENGIFGIHLRVVDQDDRVVASPTVSIASAWRPIQYETGFIHRSTLTGVQTVTIQAEGYETATIEVEPTIFNGDYTAITLNAI